MTVESTARKQTFAGAQSALTFSFRTLANHPEYIKVKNTVVATGVETDLTYGVDYTVSLESDGTGGVVTVSPTYSSAYNHTVYRVTDNLQESDYDDFNQFPADTVENDFDRRTLIAQEAAEETARTAKLPISASATGVTLPTPVDGSILGWSGTGGTLINYTLTALNAIQLDTDVTLAANSDAKVASQKATRAYVNTQGTSLINSLVPALVQTTTGGTLSLNVVFDGGGSVIATGSSSYIDFLIPFNCTILEATLISNTTGSITIDIWKALYSGIPTIGNTIVASAKPTLSSQQISRDSSLSGWTTAIPSDSTLRFVVSTSSVVTRVTMHLKLKKTSF